MPKRGSISDAAVRDPVSGASRDPARDALRDVASRSPELPGSVASPQAHDFHAADGAGGSGAAWVCESHDALFTPVDGVCCDACGCELEDREDAGDDDDLGGRGVYVWTRGDEVRLEEAPLCASCASAIGMTALARWEIEEEES